MIITNILYDFLPLSTYKETIIGILTMLIVICPCLTIYLIIRDVFRAIKNLLTRKSSKELEHQREIERKEVDVLRKSNEILLHLMHDNHREP